MRYLCMVVIGAFVFSLWFVSPTKASDQQTVQKHFTVYPIGHIQKRNGRTKIILDEKYQPGLLGLEGFSHVQVLYWFDRNDTPEKRATLRVYPKGKTSNPLSGVFATRAPVRPNLIALSLCKIISVRKNVIEIDRIDAFPDTPVLDLKPYIPGMDEVSATCPEWVNRK